MAETANSYKLDFKICYLECSNFKEKELLYIRNLISTIRLGHQLSFNCYATITFNDDDKKHVNPNVTELSNYGRGKTNGIVFTINNDVDDLCTYNKLLIYKTQYSNSGSPYYGYVLYNEDKNLHIYSPGDCEYYELCIHIFRTLRNINNPLVK